MVVHVACLQEPAIAAEGQPGWAVFGASGACADPGVGRATTEGEAPIDPEVPVRVHPNAATMARGLAGYTEPAAIAGAADAAWRVEEGELELASVVDVAKARAHPGGLQIGAASAGERQWGALGVVPVESDTSTRVSSVAATVGMACIATAGVAAAVGVGTGVAGGG